MPLSQKDGKELIKLARQSINSYFSNKELNVDDNINKKYSQKQGVFVTLNIDDNLRGCIGFPEPTLPLYEAIIEAAKSAAFSDPRFEPLSKDEFKDVKIEVSVLSVPELIKVIKAEEYIDKIKIGYDGLIIRGYNASGLLFPGIY